MNSNNSVNELPPIASRFLVESIRGLLEETLEISPGMMVSYFFSAKKFGLLESFHYPAITPLPQGLRYWEWLAFRRCNHGWKVKGCYWASNRSLHRAIILDAEVVEMLDRLYHKMRADEEDLPLRNTIIVRCKYAER